MIEAVVTRSLRRGAVAAASLLAVAALAAPARAQYREPGSGIQVPVSRQQALAEAVEKARWRLGKVRVAPWIGLRDVSYVRGDRRADGGGTGAGDEQQSDLTATAGAGVKAYLPLGKAVLAAHAMPEYSWWQKQDERNAVIGRYGVGLFGYFNRLETEVTARRVEDVGFLSPDLLVRQPVLTDDLSASAQVRLGGATAVFASGRVEQTRVDDPPGLTAGQTSDLLNRDATSWRGGARYLLRAERGHLGAGIQGEENEFLERGAPRSNDGTGWYAELLLRGANLDVGLDYVARKLEPTEGSAFPGYDTGTGNVVVSIHPGHRLRASVYGFRELRYSALALQRYFEEQRAGAALGMVLGRGNLVVFYEAGENRFFGDAVATPSEDASAYGATVDLPIGEYLALRVGSRREVLDPEIGPEREIREVIGALSLTLGSGQGDW